MIKKIAIYDFQKHRKRVVRFAPTVTVLHGPTEAGKSSVLRALRWNALNKPRGKEMLGRWGDAPYCLVKVWYDDHVVSRKAGPDENAYRLDDGPWLRAMKTKVPVEVEALVNLGEVNFQGQHDGPFWFLLSPPEVSRRLNAIINLSTIDRMLSVASAEVKKRRILKEAATERLKAVREEKSRTAWAVGAAAALDRADRAAERRDATVVRVDVLAGMIRELTEAVRVRRIAARAATAAGRALGTANAVATLTQNVADLRGLIAGVRRTLRTPGVPDVDRLARRRSARDRTVGRVRQLEMFCLWIAEQEYELCQYEKRLKEISSAVARVKSCPVCGRPVRNPERLRAATSTSPFAHLHAEPNLERPGSIPKKSTSTS